MMAIGTIGNGYVNNSIDGGLKSIDIIITNNINETK